MDLQARRREQSYHQRLGCLSLVTAVFVAIFLAGIVMAFLPPVPLVATIGFYALAVVLAGAVDRGLRRLLGYDARKASLRYLRPEKSDTPPYSSSPPADPSSAKEPSDENSVPSDE